MCVRSVHISAFLLLIACGVFDFSLSGAQESQQRPSMLVTSFGPGAIALPQGPAWKLQSLTVFDGGRRPAIQYEKGAELVVSFMLFENLSGNPTSQGCRSDAITPIIQQRGKAVSKRTDGEMKNTADETLSTTSFLVEVAPGHYQRNLFGLAGNATMCAEAHISTVHEAPAGEGEDVVKTVLADLSRPELSADCA